MTSLLAFDLETHLVQPGLLAPPIVCGSFASRLGYTFDKVLTTPTEAINHLQGALNTDVVLCGMNIAYDFGCVLAARPDLFPLVWKAYVEERVFDVGIAATLNAIYDGRLKKEGSGATKLFRKDGSVIPSGRYSLEEVTYEWTGRKDAKKNDRWRLSYALLENIPIDQWPEDARQYPIDDAVNTLESAEAQLKGAKNLDDLPVQAHAAFCAHLGAMWGIRANPESVATLKTEVEGHIAELQEFAIAKGLLKKGGTKKAPKWVKDTKLLKEMVFKAYDGLPPSTPTGETALSRETLEDSGDETLQKFAQVGVWDKFKTYLPTLEIAARVPLNVRPNILLATGRVSYDGLIQLIPRSGGVRECFEARPDHVISSVDYAAIEMSTLAQVCLWSVGWSKLADALNDGLDPHSLLGAQLINTGYADFFARKETDPEIKRIRQAGKAANFGFPGMMGGPKLVVAKRREGDSICEWFGEPKCGVEKVREWKNKELDAPLCRSCVEHAETLRKSYLTQWPEIQHYWRWVEQELKRNQGAVTQFVSGRVRGDLRSPQAANTLFQGLAADGAKRALVKMTEEMYLDDASPLFGSRLLIFAHDETLIEIPEEKAHEAAFRQAAIMVEEMRKLVPDVKVSAEPALMRKWSKKASTKYDEKGRLIPWET